MTAAPLLSVWPVAQQPARLQRQGRYLPASSAHPAKMLPALARTVIEQYSEPGELVLDPLCGIGTTLVEAIHLGRDGIGVELEPRWAALAAGNVLRAREQGATGNALALRGDARRLAYGLLDELAGSVPLILTSPPYGPSVHGQVRKHPDRVETFADRYSDDRHNLALLPQRRRLAARPRFADALTDVLAACRRMLTADGRLVLTVRPYRRGGGLVDLPGAVVGLACASGFALEARHVALLCGLQGAELVSRASFFQIHHQRHGAIPRMQIVAHEDVLVFGCRR